MEGGYQGKMPGLIFQEKAPLLPDLGRQEFLHSRLLPRSEGREPWLPKVPILSYSRKGTHHL